MLWMRWITEGWWSNAEHAICLGSLSLVKLMEQSPLPHCVRLCDASSLPLGSGSPVNCEQWDWLWQHSKPQKHFCKANAAESNLLAVLQLMISNTMKNLCHTEDEGRRRQLDGAGKSDLPADYPETCFPALHRPELWWIDGCVFRLHSPHVTCRFDSRSIIWQQWNVKKLQGWENKEGLLQAATCSGLDLNSHWMYSPVHLTCCRQKVKLYLTFLELEV